MAIVELRGVHYMGSDRFLLCFSPLVGINQVESLGLEKLTFETLVD